MKLRWVNQQGFVKTLLAASAAMVLLGGLVEPPVVAHAAAPTGARVAADDTLAPPHDPGPVTPVHPPAEPAASDASPTLSVDVQQTTPHTQGVSAPFDYVIEFSCSSQLAACTDVEIVVPLEQLSPLAQSAAPMREWGAQIISSDTSLVAEDSSWQVGEQTRSVTLLKPLAPGYSGSFRVRLSLPVGYVANETSWRLQPTIQASNADPVVAPTAVTSTATASSRHFTSMFHHGGGSEPYDTPAGSEFDMSMRTHFQGMDDDMLRHDPLKPYRVTLALPPEVEFVGFLSAACEEGYDPATRTLTCAGIDEDWQARIFTLRLSPDTPVGTIINLRAVGVGTRIGETEESVVDSVVAIRATADVVSTVDYGYSLEGNGFRLNSRDTLVPKSETPVTAELNLLAGAQRLATVSTVDVAMPCRTPRTPGLWTEWSYNPSCTEPLVTAVSARFEGKNLPASGPVALVVVLGNGDEHTISVGETPVSLAAWEGEIVGLRLADIALDAWTNALPPSERGFFHLLVELELPDEPELTDADWLQVGSTYRVRAANDATNTATEQVNHRIMYREATLAAGIADERSEVIDGWTWGDPDVAIRASAHWQAPAGEKFDSKAVGVLLPAGLGFEVSPALDVEVEENFGGSGRTLVRLLNGDWDWAKDRGFLAVDSRSLAPGLYEYDIYHGFIGYEATSCEPWNTQWPAVAGQQLLSGVEDVLAAGETSTLCHATLPLFVKGVQTGHSVVKSVRGDGDAEWVGAPGTTAVAQDGTGSAEYRLQWANTGPTALHGVAVYDVLPAPGDAGSVGALAGLPRGSDFAVTYESVSAPDGFAVAYSESENPCRPELGDEDGACVDDWSMTPPASLAEVRALRFTPDAPVPAGVQAEFVIGVAVPAIAGGQVAVNTVAAGAVLEDGRPIPAVESAFVGVGAELRDAEIVVSKSADVPESDTVGVGDRVTYAIEVRNSGGVPGEVRFDDLLAGVTDDATLVGAPIVAGSESVTAAVLGNVIELRGALAAGEAATISYTVEVSAADARGDHSLRNFVVTAGGSAGDACLPEDATCTQHAVSDLVLRKSADPESGTVLAPGAAVTYALEVENLGGDTELALTDMLAGVLDDAELVGELTVSPDTVTAEVVGDELVLSGTLAAGASATVTYGVRVKDAAIGGDAMLRNWFVAAGSALPEKCVADAVNCTVHPVDVGGATKPPATIDPPVTVTPPGGGSSGGLSATGRSSGAGPVWAAGALVLLLGAAMWRGGRLRSGAMSAVARR